MKRLLSLFLALSMLLSLGASFTVLADSEGEDYTFYCREALAKMKNGENLVFAYDRIVDCVEHRRESADLEDLVISRNELATVFEAYRSDAHGHFWLTGAYSMSAYSESHIVSFIPKYTALAGNSEKDLAEARKTFDNKVDELIRAAGIRNNMSDYEKEKRLHDVLVLHNSYVKGENAHNEYGAIVEAQSVCQGYATAFQYLLRKVGIEAFYIAGHSKGEAHGWNIVNIDGEYYFVDSTWADPVTNNKLGDERDIFYGYFNVCAETLAEDHIWTEPAFGLPEIVSKDSCYYTKNNKNYLDTETVTPAAIASLFNNGFARIGAKNASEAAKLAEFFMQNHTEILTLAGYDLSAGASFHTMCSGREAHLFIEGTLIPPAFLLGDLDFNGTINSVDSNLLKRIIIGRLTPTEDQRKAGDMDQNGTLNNMDANVHKRKILGN